jgi:hypothetical protein
MDAALLNKVRRTQTENELKQLKSAISKWREDRDAADVDDERHYAGRHATQLDAIESVFQEALKQIENGLAALDLTRPTGQVYEQCRTYEQVTIWLERLWQYIREKFDQHDDNRLGPLLKAADELVWSCYRPVLKAAKQEKPVPLTYVETQYSPAARQRSKDLPKPLQLATTMVLDESLKKVEKHIQSLPLPIIMVPSWCVDSPWWLVYVAHEVGHHIQSDLDLISHFQEGFRQVALKKNANDTLADQWGIWGEEVFADIFSALMMGPWAVLALSEITRGTDEDMMAECALSAIEQRGSRYPPAVVRLLTMNAILSKLGLAGMSELRGLSLNKLAEDPRVSQHVPVVEAVAEFALGQLPHNLGTLKNLCGWNAAPYGDNGNIDTWVKGLAAQDPPPKETALETARYITSASLRTWNEITLDADDDKRLLKMGNLASSTKAMLFRNSPIGRRAGLPDGRMPEQGSTLFDLLLEATSSPTDPYNM